MKERDPGQLVVFLTVDEKKGDERQQVQVAPSPSIQRKRLARIGGVVRVGGIYRVEQNALVR